MLESILNALIPVFILIGIGYIFQKSQKSEPRVNMMLCRLGVGSCNTWSSILNSYALHLALPALIFSSLISVEITSLPDISFILYTFGAMLVFMGILLFIIQKTRLSTDVANAYFFGGFFGNTAYIGFAYLLNLFADSGATLSLITAIHLILAFTIGIMILERSTQQHISIPGIIIKTAKNPLLISVFLGVLMLVSNIDVPYVLTKAISMIGNSASPVVLIALGTFIASEWKHDRTMVHAMNISLLKLLAMPAVFILFALLTKSDSGVLISVLEATMPVALTNFALAESYAINKTMIANAIIVSTILSIVTIPLITWIAMWAL